MGPLILYPPSPCHSIPTSQPLTLHTVYDLVHLAYRPIVLTLASQGQAPMQIAATLEAQYGVTVDPKIVSRLLTSMHIGGSKGALAMSTRREMRALQDEAMSAYIEFKGSYLSAKNLSTYDDEGAKLRLDEMRFAASEFGKWWDRMARFYPLTTPSDSGSSTTNILNIIAQETRNGKLDPDTFDRIISQMGDGEGPPDAVPTQAGTVGDPPAPDPAPNLPVEPAPSPPPPAQGGPAPNDGPVAPGPDKT